MVDLIDDLDTVLVPLTGHVRMARPSEEERAAFIADLQVQSDNIKSGQYIVFERDDFIDWMMGSYSGPMKGR